MDINCTHKCHHQYDGKCTLNQLPGYSQTVYTANDVDCPYYSESSNAPQYPNIIA